MAFRGVQTLRSVATWLVGLHPILVALIFAGFFALVVVAAAVVARRFAAEDLQPVASAMMSGLGAAFGVLLALTIANEVADFRAATETVVDEAATGARLAWASITSGTDPTVVQHPLAAYIAATTTDGWRALGRGQSGSPEARARLADLQRAVRARAEDPGLESAGASELLAGVNDLSRLRRTRIAIAERGLEDLYLAILVITSAALVANAVFVTSRRTRSMLLLPAGLVVVVVLALTVALDFERAVSRRLHRVQGAAHHLARRFAVGLLHPLTTPAGTTESSSSVMQAGTSHDGRRHTHSPETRATRVASGGHPGHHRSAVTRIAPRPTHLGEGSLAMLVGRQWAPAVGRLWADPRGRPHVGADRLRASDSRPLRMDVRWCGSSWLSLGAASTTDGGGGISAPDDVE